MLLILRKIGIGALHIIPKEAELENSSDRTAELAVRGLTKAILALQKLTDIDLRIFLLYVQSRCLPGRKTWLFQIPVIQVQEALSCISIRTLLIRYGTQFWEMARNSGSSLSGWCPDTLRLEMGFCLYGNDLDDTISYWSRGWGGLRNLWMEEFYRAMLEKQKAEEPYVSSIGFGWSIVAFTSWIWIGRWGWW